MSSLLVLNATDMVPIANIQLGKRVPMGFHTIFLNANLIEGKVDFFFVFVFVECLIKMNFQKLRECTINQQVKYDLNLVCLANSNLMANRSSLSRFNLSKQPY